MAITTMFEGAQIIKPSAVSFIDVDINAQSPLTALGVVGIVGESYGGAPGTTDGVQTYDATQLYDIAKKYISGPIVEACRVLLSPSKDAAIQAGASRIRIYKTNPSTYASGTLLQMDDAGAPAAILNLTSDNYGIDENNINVYVTEGTVEDDHASITSGTITFPVALTSTQTLVVNAGGSDYTFTAPSSTTYTQANLLILLNDAANWAPSCPIVATASGTSKIKLELDVSLAAFDGFESMHEYAILNVTGTGVEVSLELLDKKLFATSGSSAGVFTVAALGDLAVGMWCKVYHGTPDTIITARVASISGTGPYTITLTTPAGAVLDLSAYTTAANAAIWTGGPIVNSTSLVVTPGTGGWVRGYRGNRSVFVKKNTTLETIPENANSEVFRIFYKGTGTACTMTCYVTGGVKKLITTVTGGPGSEALDITLSNYTTVQQVVDYINNFNAGASYVCYSDYFNAATLNPLYLDFYSTIDIKTFPLAVKASLYEISNNINETSQLVTSARVDNVYGQMALVSSTARRFLSGATNGATTNSMIQAGFDALLTKECDIVVPLFSRDATDDIADAMTNASSSYTISSIISIADTHCRTASSIINRRERQAWVGYKGTYAASKTLAQTLNSEYTSLVIQDTLVTDSQGTSAWKNPHIFAALNAGLEAGAAIGLPLTRKALNCLGVRHSEFDPVTQYADAIQAGLYFAEQPDLGGIVVVCANTTYQRDASFVWNRRSVIRAAFFTAKTLRSQLELIYIGRSRAGSSNSLVGSIYASAVSILQSLLQAGALTGDQSNGGSGFRGLQVSMNGSIVSLSVIITPAQGVDFILENITLAPINDVA